MMATILPLLAFLSGVLFLAGRRPEEGWRRAFVRAAILWAAYAVLSLEILSLVRSVTASGLIVAWSVPLAACGVWLLRRRRSGRLALPGLAVPKHGFDRLLLAGVLVVLGLTGLVAWLTPPQTWDSLVYHMPRVAHWAQLQAVRHFATGIDVQNSMPPGAEMLVLHTYVLAGGDRLATFVSWFAMLGSLVAASLVAARLGAGPRGQLLAAVVTATIPMGIVQASSTKTDYLVGFWALAAALESLEALQLGPRRDRLVYAGLAAGMGLLTKPIAAAYLAPFGLLVGAALLRRLPLTRALTWMGVGVVLVLGLNAGHLTRNTLLYGNPISGAQRIDLHANQLLTLPGLLSNVMRNAALHTGTPQASINRWVYETVFKAHIKLGVDVNDPRTTSVGPYRIVPGIATHEDLVGNLIHAVLSLVLTAATLLAWRRLGTLAALYALAVAATFVLFSLLFKWQIFSSRYHLPFFVLSAPLIARALTGLLPPNPARWVGVVLLLGGLPWLLSINSRPLVPLPNRALVGSVLTEPRETLLFASNTGLRETYGALVDRVNEQGCRTVGVMVSGHGAEYPLWVLLGAPDPGLEMGWLVGGNPSERFEDPDFQPCAVFCQKCPDHWEEIRGLPKVYDDGQFRLFLEQ